MLKPAKNEVRKPTKTISGITPVAIMLPPRKCKHGNCTYCPSLNVPQSYTPKSPVVIRAAEVNYDSYKQVKARMKAFEVMNHPTEKIEIIIMGGTFLEYPKEFQYNFVKNIYDALNERKSSNLEKAQKLNEKSKHRCVALCVETRPDVCIKFIKRMREFGVTRVELGVQIIDDKIYKLIQRGHLVKDVVDATRELKNAGFKVGYHIMPGLPGSNPKKDLELFKKLFSDERFKPDQLKIYPCQVIQGSKLEQDFWAGKYKPYTKEQLEVLLNKMMKLVPRYCRVMRVMREIPPEYLVSGTTRIDLRKVIEADLRKDNSKIKEIRYREIGFASKDTDSNLKLKITKYSASNGKEFFLEIVNDEDILFGLLRLRIVNGNAFVRELHVYGQSLKLGERGKISQHIGLGKLLMGEAEKISQKEKVKKISVISGVGVREYYKNIGYKLENTYMVKFIN
ncbi:tRNA uridine(34) 5-carboxymethylaminomethyl modification radical SAM/GNAT enzyme Elp3 [Candidatus Pacearchaeota archaeon]|jgi:elongator complex protein 3|nr:tRNA uridine(34) 5-carboxymethylaminomethyl modification radical SAM/GNAT enzyme Elp3 [Candidatus Pacearchaeota archaeon]